MGIVCELKQSQTSRMDDAELKHRYEEIKNRKPDPDWARLFAEARNRGRTQEEIAAVLGLQQQHISRLLTFADWITWLESTPFGVNPDFRLHEVKEGTFRRFWNRHGELNGVNDRRRAVLTDLVEHQKESTRHNNRRYAELIKKLEERGLINGRRYRVETIAEKVGEPVDVVKGFLIKRKYQPVHGMQIERVGEDTFKIHPMSRKRVDPKMILSKMQEYLDELREMGNRPIGSHNIVPDRISALAYMIEKVIKDTLD